MKKIYFLFVVYLLAMACTPRVYSSADAVENVYAYNEIAIIPPTVNFNQASFDFGGYNLDILQMEYSQKFHQAMYSWFLKRKTENKYPFKIQDPSTTLNILKQSPIAPHDLTSAEMADMLGVDAVIISDYFVSKPFPNGINVASQVILGKSVAENRSEVNMTLFDKKKNESIWNYNYEMNSGIMTPQDLVNELLRNSSKRFPKIKKKN